MSSQSVGTAVCSEPQARVLDAVRVLSADGWPVTAREVQDLLGYGSPSTTHKHLVALERLGLLATNPRTGSRRSGWLPTQLTLA